MPHSTRSASVFTFSSRFATTVRKLASEIARAMKNPATLARLDPLALLPVADTPEQFAASLKEEQAMWGSFTRQHNITPE